MGKIFTPSEGWDKCKTPVSFNPEDLKEAEKDNTLEGKLTDRQKIVLDDLKYTVSTLFTFGRNYLYTVPKSGSPEDLDAHQRYIERVGSQRDINTFFSITGMERENLDGCTIYAIRSDLPLVYTLPLTDAIERQGSAESYVGKVKAYDVFKRDDGRYCKRIELTDARRIDWDDGDEFKRLVSAKLAEQYIEHFDAINSIERELKNSLGTDTIVVEDSYENIDIGILETPQSGTVNLYNK